MFLQYTTGSVSGGNGNGGGRRGYLQIIIIIPLHFHSTANLGLLLSMNTSIKQTTNQTTPLKTASQSERETRFPSTLRKWLPMPHL
jgi:hypothetical protein